MRVRCVPVATGQLRAKSGGKCRGWIWDLLLRGADAPRHAIVAADYTSQRRNYSRSDLVGRVDRIIPYTKSAPRRRRRLRAPARPRSEHCTMARCDRVGGGERTEAD